MSATASAGETEVCRPHHPDPDLGTLMRESSKFIVEYRWVWDLQVTRFFQLQWWQKIPSEVGSNSHCVAIVQAPAQVY